MDPHLITCLASDAENAGRCVSAVDGGMSAAIGKERRAYRAGGAGEVRGTEPRPRPPFCHDGTERRIHVLKTRLNRKAIIAEEKMSYGEERSVSG